MLMEFLKHASFSAIFIDIPLLITLILTRKKF